jgi:hypothetical protein
LFFDFMAGFAPPPVFAVPSLSRFFAFGEQGAGATPREPRLAALLRSPFREGHRPNRAAEAAKHYHENQQKQ